MSIKLEKEVGLARFRNPNLKFEVEDQKIEYRKDPLTGRMSLIPQEYKKKAAFYYGVPDKKALNEAVESSRSLCYFCPEKIEQSTPKFLREISEEGKFRVGKAICFPNIFPYFEHCAVTTVTTEHYIPLNSVTPDLYGNAIQASINYIKAVYECDVKAQYPLIGANFLLPAGSTVVHPHIQVLVGSQEFYNVKLLREASFQFYRAHEKNFWKELIQKEQELGERYVAQTGNIHWYTPFAPLGNNEVRALAVGRGTFLDLTDEDISMLGKGISNILHYYSSKNISTFNFMLYSAPFGQDLSDSFTVGFQIISRPPFRPLYINLDAWFLQLLANGGLIIEFPEIIAQELKAFF